MNGKFIEFYVNNFNSLKSFEEADINFIPSILRRRMSKLDKCVISVLNKAFTDNVNNVIFSSKKGEIERLLKLIEQYSLEKEVSPNLFSGSVHNYSAGFFLLNNKKAIPYNALASGDCSISAGLLSAVVSKYDLTSFCYVDPKDEDYIALALNVSKHPLNNSVKYRLFIQNNDNIKDDFDSFIQLFNGNLYDRKGFLKWKKL